jgi:hypothetical protein
MNAQDYLLLQCARPRCQDDDLPEIAAALLRAQAAPEHAAWLRSTRAQDALWGTALRSIQPPSRLADALPTKKPVLLSRRGLLGWAAAAGVAVTAASAWLWRARSNGLQLADLMDAVADISAKGVTLSLMSMNKLAVAQWLDSRSLPRAQTLPGKLDEITRKGCHLYQIEGEAVSLECFVLPEGMRELHLFSVVSSALAEPPAPEAPPTIAPHTTGQTTATWSRDGLTHILCSRESAEATARILS